MTDRSDVSSPTPVFGLLMRIWWMFLGLGALLVVLVVMAFERGDLPSLIDAVFAALVVSLVAARFTDVRFFEGTTAEGAPATMGDFRRYALRLAAGSATGWGVANAVALL